MELAGWCGWVHRDERLCSLFKNREVLPGFAVTVRGWRIGRMLVRGVGDHWGHPAGRPGLVSEAARRSAVRSAGAQPCAARFAVHALSRRLRAAHVAISGVCGTSRISRASLRPLMLDQAADTGDILCTEQVSTKRVRIHALAWQALDSNHPALPAERDRDLQRVRLRVDRHEGLVPRGLLASRDEEMNNGTIAPVSDLPDWICAEGGLPLHRRPGSC